MSLRTPSSLSTALLHLLTWHQLILELKLPLWIVTPFMALPSSSSTPPSSSTSPCPQPYSTITVRALEYPSTSLPIASTATSPPTSLSPLNSYGGRGLEENPNAWAYPWAAHPCCSRSRNQYSGLNLGKEGNLTTMVTYVSLHTRQKHLALYSSLPLFSIFLHYSCPHVAHLQPPLALVLQRCTLHPPLPSTPMSNAFKTIFYSQEHACLQCCCCSA